MKFATKSQRQWFFAIHDCRQFFDLLMTASVTKASLRILEILQNLREIVTSMIFRHSFFVLLITYSPDQVYNFSQFVIIRYFFVLPITPSVTCVCG